MDCEGIISETRVRKTVVASIIVSASYTFSPLPGGSRKTSRMVVVMKAHGRIRFVT